MPLDPAEACKAAIAIIRLTPKLIRWKRLTQDERRAVLDALADATATLAMDCID